MNEPVRLIPRCPICGKPAAERFVPFCSARCSDLDLSRWLKGVYAIPGEPAEPEPSKPSDEDD